MPKKEEKVTLVPKTSFPKHTATDAEKESYEYGLGVAKAIQHEWFRRRTGSEGSGSQSCLYYDQWQKYQELRLYARGEQPLHKYKEALKVNGDNSHLNLDWSAVPIGAKFTDILVNGMNDRMFSPRAYSQDVTSSQSRDHYQKTIEMDMVAQEFLRQTQNEFGIDAYNVKPDDIPQTDEELQLHMQLKYKPAIEIAEETAIETVFDMNDYQDTRYRINHDLVTLGKAIVKHDYVYGEGIRIKYVDPQRTIHNYTENPHHGDEMFYWGEVESIPITELKKINPNLEPEDIEEISKLNNAWNSEFTVKKAYRDSLFQQDVVNVLYFNYKTDKKVVAKIKYDDLGGEKAIMRDDSFNPPEDVEGFERVEKTIDVWYKGVLVLGTDKLLQWELMSDMIRPDSAFQRAPSNYICIAPKMQGGHYDITTSMVKRMMPFIDQIQLAHLKIQQVAQKLLPDGVFIDADGFSGIDLGDGGVYSPAKALELFWSTGSVVGRSYTEEGEFNNARVPIQELNHSGGAAKLSALFELYNQNVNMLRDVTGINQAKDASTPDPKSLVGVQKLAALNSNTATRHILDASIFMTRKLAEGISLRIADVLKFSDEREEFANQIGRYNVATIESIIDLPLHSFGIFIEVSPDAEEENTLETNIQIALGEQSIELEDAIEIRQIRNIKTALEMLKLKKRLKRQRDQEDKFLEMQAQTEANIQSSQAAAQAKMQQLQAEAQAKIQHEQAKTQGQIEVLSHEAQLKSQLMQQEFDYNIQLAQAQNSTLTRRDEMKEDRKDKRIKMQSEASSIIAHQKDTGGLPTKFESSEDTMDGFDLDR